MLTFMAWDNMFDDFSEDEFSLLGGIFFCTLFTPFTLALDMLFSPIEIISLIIFMIVRIIQRIKGE